LASVAERSGAGQCPLVGPVGRTPRGRLAPLGGVERPRRVVRFARLINRRGRAFWPAFGRRRLRRHLSLTWLPRRVVPKTHTGARSGRVGRLVGSCAEGSCPRNPSGYARSRKPTSIPCAGSTPIPRPEVPTCRPASAAPTSADAAGRKTAWLGDDSSQLAVALPDGTLVGIVAWRSIETGGPRPSCLEIGALLFPEHRGRGLGTAAQRLLTEYLFATTLASFRTPQG
jgi:Acetyltransferase (GNAT) domain